MSWTIEESPESATLLAKHQLTDLTRLIHRESPSLIQAGRRSFLLRHGVATGGLLRILRGRPSAGEGLHQQLLALSKRGLACARPVLFGCQRIAGIRCRWVLLTEVPTGSQPLPVFVRRNVGPTLPGRRERRRLLEELASLLKDVGRCGWANPGLAPPSILVNGWPGSYRFCFLGSPLAHRVDGTAPVEPGLLLALTSLARDRFSCPEVMRFVTACGPQPRTVRRALRLLRA